MRNQNKQGSVKLVIAWNERFQEFVHIEQVVSGLSCNCLCPKCKTRLVARKGRKTAHHFAHHSIYECEGAWETALHLYAKKILQEQKTIKIPEIVIKREFRAIVLVEKSWIYNFEQISIEQFLGNFQPDAIITHPHEILIEFAVTHFCEPEKYKKIKKKNISAIEIDLSKTPNEIGREELKNYILLDAPRVWLHSRRYDKERKQIILNEKKDEESAALENARLAKEAEELTLQTLSEIASKIIKVFKTPFKNPNEILTNWNYEGNVRQANFVGYIGKIVKGRNSFQFEEKYWQAAFIDAFILKPIRDEWSGWSKNFTEINIYFWLIKRGFLDDCFPSHQNEYLWAMDFVRSYKVGVKGPLEAIEEYLTYLKHRKLLWKDKQGYYRSSDYNSELKEYKHRFS